MNSPHVLPTAAALLAAAALTLPGAAAAKGGSKPPPPSAPAPVLCDYAADGPTADGLGTVFSNQVGDAGCITVVSRSSGITLYSLAVTPGWTTDVQSNGETSAGGVRVVFDQTATGAHIEARIEPGKTWIR